MVRIIFHRGKMWRVVWKKVRVRKKSFLGSNRREYLKHRETARAFVLQKIAQINCNKEFLFKRVAIKNNKTRWGSCSRKGNLNFNYKLIFLPVHLAEYVVAHELCHLKEFNHSRKFWNLVEKFVPDYKEYRRALKKMI